MKTLYVSLLFFFGLIGFVPVSSAQQYGLLPHSVRKLMYAEQVLIDRGVNTQKIKATTNKQDPKFAPESGNVFLVKSYWIPAEQTLNFAIQNLSPSMKKLFIKEIEGKKYIRILVHPESEDFYKPYVEKALPSESFWAMATSSSRTLLVWQDGHEDHPFFAKLSLDKELGKVVRTIPLSETVRSIGTTQVLDQEKALPKDFKFLREIFGVIPKGLDRGGMLIREIPPEILDGRIDAIPLFSLYAEKHDGTMPLLADMILRSEMKTDDFVRERLIRPFVKEWIKLAVEHGITMEPHAQNVLLVLDKTGLPHGGFLHRDLGGFGINFKFRESVGFVTPEDLPFARSIERDYHQSDDKPFDVLVPRSIKTFFEGGFVFNLDKNIPAWEKAGLLPPNSESKSKNRFDEMMWQEMRSSFTELTGNHYSGKNWDLLKAVTQAQRLHFKLTRSDEKTSILKRVCTFLVSNLTR